MNVKDLIAKRFITFEEFTFIDEHSDFLNEDCGISGTGKGKLFTIYENNSGEYGKEVGEVVVAFTMEN